MTDEIDVQLGGKINTVKEKERNREKGVEGEKERDV